MSIPNRLRLVLVCVVLAGALVAPVAARAIEAKPFGVTNFTMQTVKETTEHCTHPANRDEECEFENVPYSFTQAGGHPWALTTTVDLTEEELVNERGFTFYPPTHEPKDIVTSLPPGLLGNPVAAPRCPLATVLSPEAHAAKGKSLAEEGYCPADTQIGDYVLHWQDGKYTLGPIVNVTPEAGQTAEFALENQGQQPVVLTAHLVHTAQGVSGCGLPGGCYGFTVTSNEIPSVDLSGAELTFWGVPAEASHDALRGKLCSTVAQVPPGEKIILPCEGGGEVAGVAPVPFLSMPTDCSVGPETATVRADSWEEPGSVKEGRYIGYAERAFVMPGVTGCNGLSFAAGIGVEPETLLADEPVGMGVNITVPQNEQPGADATPHLRNVVVTLPEGVSISPGVVDGVQACEETGPEGINFEGELSEEEALNGELQLAPGRCPDASIVGTTEAVTPELDEPVKGHVYLARPLCGGAGQEPCTEQDALDGRLYQLYLEFGGKGPLANTGINVKAHGYVEANPATGQLTTVVEENPQVPISDIKVNLNGGPRAPLDNPAVCGPAVTTAELTPWSEPGTTPEGLLVGGTPDATPSSRPYEVTGCASGGPPLNPGFVAGTVTPNAGQYTAFTLNFTRQDREQYIKGIQVHTPPGLLGMLSSVPLCGEAQADEGRCSAESQIGTTRVASGAGSHPFEIEGKVYLTGPYDGAPFGLSVVTPAVAGPFNLGLVVVRARIDVNPENSTLTVTTDETGPYALPQILDGVPLRLQRITVDIDRPGFMFNPTNCGAPGSPGAQQVTATVSGSNNTKSEVQSAFAVGGCKSLAFEPKFTASTSARTSRGKGASLDVKLSYPKDALGNDANIAKVKVELPKQLPSELKTLQQACLASVFESDAAACPAASIVGIARANTPVLPVQLTGPAYFVSRGTEWPDLVIVLQGDGVRVNLLGETFISRKGVTSTTINGVPDVPVSSFELYLPEGKDSALAAPGGKLCQRQAKLKMPTEFTAQNGAVFKQNTRIAVTGCSVAATKTRPKTKAKARHAKAGKASANRRKHS